MWWKTWAPKWDWGKKSRIVYESAKILGTNVCVCVCINFIVKNSKRLIFLIDKFIIWLPKIVSYNSVSAVLCYLYLNIVSTYFVSVHVSFVILLKLHSNKSAVVCITFNEQKCRFLRVLWSMAMCYWRV